MVRPRQVSDEEILETARHLFIEHGPAVATSTIASQLSISQAALFKRFGNKHTLMLRAMGMPDGTPEWAARLADGPAPDEDLPTALLEMCIGMDRFFQKLMPAIAVLKTAGVDPQEMFCGQEPPPMRAHRAVTGWLERAHELGLANIPDPSSLALVIMGAVQTRCLLVRTFPDQAPHQEPQPYLEQFVDRLWHGLAPAPETSP